MSKLNGRIERLEEKAPEEKPAFFYDIIRLLREGEVTVADVKAAYPKSAEWLLKKAGLNE